MIYMTQNQHVLEWLKGNNSLTQLDALKRWGINRLAARVLELKRDGHNIQSEMVHVTNRFGDKCRVSLYTMGK